MSTPRQKTEAIPAPSPFISGIQYAWDSTSLGNFMACPRRYQFVNLQGYTTTGSKIELEFGILYHKGLEVFQHEILKDGKREAAIRRTLMFLLAELRKPISFKGTPGLEGGLVFQQNMRTPFTLLRAVLNHLDKYSNDPMRTVILENGRPAVELSFRFELDEYAASGQPFMLSGHLDRVCELSGEFYFTDYKTTKSTLSSNYFEQYATDIQMDIYSIGSRVSLPRPAVGGFIDAVQLAVGFSRYERGLVSRTASQLQDSLDNIQQWLHLARQFSEVGKFPMNKKSCFLCAFKSVCGSQPGARELILRTEFIQVETWNPLKPR
jgi:hypothetical protein